MYVIVVGTAILQEQGEVVATYHPGDYFGEFALLGRSSPADAIAKGHNESQLLAISNVPPPSPLPPVLTGRVSSLLPY